MIWKSIGVAAIITLLISCTVAPGPLIPLGLGPGLDQIVPLLLVIAIAVLVWKFGPELLRRFRPSSKWNNEEASRSIARQRYARGEISRDEFFRITEDLNRS